MKRSIETRLPLAFLCSSACHFFYECYSSASEFPASHFSLVSPFGKQLVLNLGVGGISAMDYVEETDASTRSTCPSGPRKHIGGVG